MSSLDLQGCEDAGVPIDAVCASHPERRASIECPHCGSYACGDCTVDTLWGDVMCDACQRHGRAQYPVPWEESLSPIAFVHTAYLVFADTGSMFGAMPAGRLRRAMGFVLCVSLLSALASGLTEWLFAPRHWADEAPGLSTALLYSTGRDLLANTLFMLLVASVAHGAARALGGRARFAHMVRAICYLTAVDLLGTAGAVTDAILGGNTFTVVLGLVSLFFVGWAVCAFAEQRYGLARGKAILAGAAPVAVLVLVAVALIAATLMLAPRIVELAR